MTSIATVDIARLRLLERVLVPLRDYSIVGLIADLLRMKPPGPVEDDPAWAFSQVVVEEMRRLPAGSRLRSPHFETSHPGCRADAQLVAQELLRSPGVVAGFLAYLPAVCRYLDPARQRPFQFTPSVGEWASALTADAQEHAAVRRALRRGWISPAQAQRLGDVEHRIAALPGQDDDDDMTGVVEIMAHYYQQRAARYLGNEIHTPKRAEIYLDVGSATPDPLVTPNPLTLTALVLAAAVTRAGGRVGLTLFADTQARLRPGRHAPRTLARFLMHYLGGGSVFPVAALRRSTRATRIIIADGACDLTAAVRAAPDSILLLHAAPRDHVKSLKANVGRHNLRIAAITPEHGGILARRNLRDFQRALGFKVEDWTA